MVPNIRRIGDALRTLGDKADDSGCSFILDNDTDSKGNESLADDPSVWSGSGWFRPRKNGARDWLFTAEIIEE